MITQRLPWAALAFALLAGTAPGASAHVPKMLVTGITTPPFHVWREGLAADDHSIFYAEGDIDGSATCKILRAEATGGRVIDTLLKGTGCAVTKLLLSGDTLYFVGGLANSPAAIFSLSVSTHQLKHLADTTTEIDWALDGTALYWMEIGNKNAAIKTLDLPANQETTLWSGSLPDQARVSGVAVDSKFVYAAVNYDYNRQTSSELLKVSKKGGRPQALVSNRTGNIEGLSLNARDLYWANPNDGVLPGSINRVAISGGPVDEWKTGPDIGITSRYLVQANGELYFSAAASHQQQSLMKFRISDHGFSTVTESTLAGDFWDHPDFQQPTYVANGQWYWYQTTPTSGHSIISFAP